MAPPGSRRFDAPGNAFSLNYPADWEYSILQDDTVTFRQTQNPIGSLRLTAWFLKDEPDALNRFLSIEKDRFSHLQNGEEKLISLKPFEGGGLKGFFRISNALDDDVRMAALLWMLGSPGAKTVMMATYTYPRLYVGDPRMKMEFGVANQILLGITLR